MGKHDLGKETGALASRELAAGRIAALEIALGAVIDAVAATESGGSWLDVGKAITNGKKLLGR